MDDTADPTEPVTLAESLVALQAQRAEGAVVVRLNEHTTRIFVRDGAPIAVHPHDASAPTGDADTIWETLVGCLQWVEPTIVFDETQTVSATIVGNPCPVEPLILEAVRRQFDLQELDAAIGPFMGHRPRVLGDVSAIAERCGLYGADEQDYVALASRAETVEDLLVEGPVDLLEGYQLLYGLVLLGAVSLHDPSEPWDGPDPAAVDELDEAPIDDLDEEPIDAFDDGSTPEPPSSGRLSQEVAEAFDPGLAEFLLDVVQESEPPPISEPPSEGDEPDEPLAEDDDFPSPDQDDSLPPPPRQRMVTAPSPRDDGPDDDFPPLDQGDSLPPPPTQARARERRDAAPPRPSREDLLRQADEDARRLVAEARAAKEREATRVAGTSNKPPRDRQPPDRAPARRNPRTDPKPEPRPSRPRAERPAARTDPRAPARRSAGGRVVIEERVNVAATDSRVAVRKSRRPVATSVRPRPVVTRRKRAVPSSPGHPATPAPRDSSPSQPSRAPRSPSPRTSPPISPSPRTTPPASRSFTPPAGRSTPPHAQSTPPHGRRTVPSARSSSPRGSNPALASDPGPPSHPGRSFTPPPHSSPRSSLQAPGNNSEVDGAGDGAATERQKQLAQLHLKKGKRFLYRNNATRALPELEKAAELDPDSVELQLFALWARFTVAPGDANTAKATERELKVLAGKAMSDDRQFGFAHFVMGQLALREGRNGDAVRSLGAAVKLDPDNQDAKRGHQIAKRRATK